MWLHVCSVCLGASLLGACQTNPGRGAPPSGSAPAASAPVAHTGAAHTGAAHTGAAHTGAAHTGAAHTGAAHADDKVRAQRPEFFRYGAPLAPAKVIPLESVLATPKSYAGQVVTVDGRVRRACSRKGCWMELAEGMSPSRPGCRVTFKDYGFFVPLNSRGARARVQGSVVKRKLSASQVEHLEQEGARFSHKEADGSAYEATLVATGVELNR